MDLKKLYSTAEQQVQAARKRETADLRIAILNAAAIIQAGSFMSYQSHEVSIQPSYYENAESAVDMALNLWTEIEKRDL